MTLNETILLECEYMPCLFWFAQVFQYDTLCIEQFEYFEKATLRNRCYVAGPHGPVTLSIPVEGGRNHKCVMKDVRISYHERWQHIHWQTILSCYGRSPYFEFYQQEIESVYRTRYAFLMDFNLACLEKLWRILRIKKTYELSKTYEPVVLHDDFRSAVRASNYHLFQTKSYHQVFADDIFYPNLSILDLLFCEGPDVSGFLQILSTVKP